MCMECLLNFSRHTRMHTRKSMAWCRTRPGAGKPGCPGKTPLFPLLARAASGCAQLVTCVCVRHHVRLNFSEFFCQSLTKFEFFVQHKKEDLKKKKKRGGKNRTERKNHKLNLALLRECMICFSAESFHLQLYISPFFKPPHRSSCNFTEIN